MTKKRIADVLVNLIIIFSTLWAVLFYFVGPADALGSRGTRCFKFFTTDSNILTAVASLVYIVYLCKNKKQKIPQWIMVLKFVGTVAVTVTLLTVIFFLAPMGVLNTGNSKTYFLYFAENAFVLHFSTPVLSIVSTCFLETENPVSKKHCLLGMLPTFVYSIVYLFMVVILKIWNDFYGFTFGGKNYLSPIVIIIMTLFSLVLSLCEYKIMSRKVDKVNG